MFKIIQKVARQENALLSNTYGKGIFQMPELAFAYECGKAIKKEHPTISHDTYNWVRELKLENMGIADLVFTSQNDPYYVLEFKMDDKLGSYKRDIKKLISLPTHYEKYFCAIKHVFTDQVDGFLESMKEEFGNKAELIGYDPIETIVRIGKENDIALLSLWKVL